MAAATSASPLSLSDLQPQLKGNSCEGENNTEDQEASGSRNQESLGSYDKIA